MQLDQASLSQLQLWNSELTEEYALIVAKKLNLDLTRGKPSSEQLSLANDLDGILKGNYVASDGTDTRNYGGLDGLPEAKRLGEDLTGVPAGNILVGGNSSLTLMFQTMLTAHEFGLTGPKSAWSKAGRTKVICPVPGYDRHYTVCEQLGIEMITVAMTPTGPDMDKVEALIKSDSSIRGMWCVPKYSNPTGVVYANETVERIAQLGKIAHPDFRVFWDNAYAVHDLNNESTVLADIFALTEKYSTQDSVIQFASTSKITHAGAGVAFIAASNANLSGLKKFFSTCTIGPDKVNQLRHAMFLPNQKALATHMQKHAELLKPRFDAVLTALNHAFKSTDLGRWEAPEGGYFVSFDSRPHCAKEAVRLASEAGVKLTPAGATFPYGQDPLDCNIRIAPSVPSIQEVVDAMDVFVICIKLASVQQSLAEKTS